MTTLCFNATHDLPATKEYHLLKFYRTRDGLYVWNELHALFSSQTKKAVAPAHKLVSYKLAQAALDSQICFELSDGYVFEVSECLARLASLIEAQWGGTDGPLLNNGYVNIFYVQVAGEVVVVGADWSRGGRSWNVDASRLDVYPWSAGRRVFSVSAA